MSKNPQWWRKWNVIRNSQADPDRHHRLITSRWSPLVHVCQVLSTSVTAFISYLVYSMIDGTITCSAWSVSVEDWVVEVPLDAGERSSCTSSYWASTFQHIKNAWARNHLAWAERLHFSHLWFSTLTTDEGNDWSTSIKFWRERYIERLRDAVKQYIIVWWYLPYCPSSRLSSLYSHVEVMILSESEAV